MKRLIALMFVALPAFANIVDSTYVVTPPVTGTQCPAIQPGLTYPCAYVAIGGYTDTYQFIVVDDTLPYSFKVTSSRWRRCVLSGRAHPCYTESNTIINAIVLDAAGNGVLQLVNTSVDTSSDDWIGSAVTAGRLRAGDQRWEWRQPARLVRLQHHLPCSSAAAGSAATRTAHPARLCDLRRRCRVHVYSR
jgi:hypothetical protein